MHHKNVCFFFFVLSTIYDLFPIPISVKEVAANPKVNSNRYIRERNASNYLTFFGFVKRIRSSCIPFSKFKIVLQNNVFLILKPLCTFMATDPKTYISNRFIRRESNAEIKIYNPFGFGKGIKKCTGLNLYYTHSNFGNLKMYCKIMYFSF